MFVVSEHDAGTIDDRFAINMDNPKIRIEIRKRPLFDSFPKEPGSKPRHVWSVMLTDDDFDWVLATRDTKDEAVAVFDSLTEYRNVFIHV